MNHGVISHAAGFFPFVVVEGKLRFEDFALGSRELEFDRGYDFTGALADTVIAQGIFPGIAPVAEEGAVACGRLSKIVEHILHFHLAGALDEILESFARSASSEITLGEARNDLGNIFRGYCRDRQAVRAGVMFPFAAQHDLKMRNSVVSNLAADAIKYKIE